ALPGSHTDGRRHVAEALGRGARAVITTGEVDAGRTPVVRVAAPHRLLGRAAAHVAGDPSAALTLVGVTGTNGKTTTTYLLEAIWRAAGRRPGVVGTIAYRFDGAIRPARAWRRAFAPGACGSAAGRVPTSARSRSRPPSRGRVARSPWAPSAWRSSADSWARHTSRTSWAPRPRPGRSGRRRGRSPA